MKNLKRLPALFPPTRHSLAALVTLMLPFTAVASQQFDTITVTTNRMPSNNLLAPTTVITRTDIERLQINDLPTLLSRQPGIDMTARGGIGKDTSVFMRGTSSRHVLFLVDGVQWQSATLGKTHIQDFPVEQIERIEIVRGPRSGLYGSEAIGGVIQIFTRKGEQGINPYINVSYGTHNTKKATAGVVGANDQTSYSLNFNHESTDGINTLENNYPDDDGYRNNSISASIDHEVTNTWKVGVSLVRANVYNEFDGITASSLYKTDTVQQVLSAQSSWTINDSWTLAMQLGESRDGSEDYQDNVSTGRINTRHRFSNVTNTVRLNEKHTLNIGFDYEGDHIDSTQDYLETSRDNKAAFLSWQANVAEISWLLSGRHDNNQAYGTNNTVTAEIGYWLHDNVQIMGNYGTAFKAPSFNDLYWPNDIFGIGNPGLAPEESTSWGIGLNGTENGVDWAISFYKTKVENLIEWAPLPGCCVWTPSNVSQAEIRGIDIELATHIMGVGIMFDASWLQPEDKETGNTLTRRAKRYANLHLDKQWGQWSAGASWKLSGYRYNDTSNTTRLDGYGLVDIRATYQIHPNWSLRANISNLFDNDYVTVDGYNSLDRTLMFFVNYQP